VNQKEIPDSKEMIFPYQPIRFDNKLKNNQDQENNYKPKAEINANNVQIT